MRDLSRGPLLVGVADTPDALVACALRPAGDQVLDVVEARVDLFPGQDLQVPQDLLEACARLESAGIAVLVTIRTARQGGAWTGGEGERLRRFRTALAVASWADVEDDAAIVAEVAAAVGGRAQGQLIVSHHDFAATPPLDRLLAVVDRAHQASSGIAKVATRVNSDADRDTLFQLIAQRPERTCVIGMGASDDLRIELPSRGSQLAYGYLGRPTAPGQLSAAETHARLLVASERYAARHAGQVR